MARGTKGGLLWITMPTAVTLPIQSDHIVERLRATAELLESIAADRTVLDAAPADDRKRFLRAISLVRSPTSRTRRRLAKATAREEKVARMTRDEGMRAETGIRALRRRPVFTTPNVFPPVDFEARDVHVEPGFGIQDSGFAVQHQVDVAGRDPQAGANVATFEFRIPSPESRIPNREPRVPSPGREALEPQTCYICKRKYSVIHHFYDQLCAPCAEYNFAKRTELADLRGRVALLTGGRVKIGYQAGLKLLRAGAHVLVTTRFPRDSAARYAREPDFADWADRLEIFGLDLRHTPSVEAFCHELLSTRTRLDFIVNNACQTVRRPPEFYRHMMEGETAAVHQMPEHVRKLIGAYEGLRAYRMLPEAGEAGGAGE